MASPTSRTLTRLRRLGYVVAVVESWVPHASIRRDLWGFADVLGVHPAECVFLLVQVTTAANMASRLTKARSKPELALWLKAGGRFEVHGWCKRGPKWEVRIVEVRAGDLRQDLAAVTQQPKRRRGKSRHVQGELLWDAPAPVDVRRE
jgi:hypothetical protein